MPGFIIAIAIAFFVDIVFRGLSSENKQKNTQNRAGNTKSFMDVLKDLEAGRINNPQSTGKNDFADRLKEAMKIDKNVEVIETPTFQKPQVIDEYEFHDHREHLISDQRAKVKAQSEYQNNGSLERRKELQRRSLKEDHIPLVKVNRIVHDDDIKQHSLSKADDKKIEVISKESVKRELVKGLVFSEILDKPKSLR